MAFEATKREWSDLYVFFRLLANGLVNTGTVSGEINKSVQHTLCAIEREEHDGSRLYRILGDNIHIGKEDTQIIPREKFAVFADLILGGIKGSSEDTVVSPDGVEEFLDELKIYELDAKTQERTNLTLFFWNMDAPATGVVIRSRLSRMHPLLDGGRAANIKFELTGMKFSNPMISKVNAVEGQNTVAERMMLIESLGGILKYSDVADKVFRSNLCMIDLHFPRLLAEVLRIMQLDGITRTQDLIEAVKAMNPLKIKDELIEKHHFYEYKMKQFLNAAVTGMRPAKIYTAPSAAIQGLLLVNGKGEILYYPVADNQLFNDFLFYNTRFEQGDVQKDHYGTIEKENGILYFRLNAKVGLVKR
ncbi:HpaII family restriction endonuclease [Bacteroides sp. 519]|uniref:HpaII family restriction endonuclease n=1 Tax=Bacteroides sp. 519 TaxID=2302937 RepID=UPI0013D445A7|nr:HpaII family restriction endonuclease [Bacteroides sp. 519]NDV58434.1 HpaII family restriction endonuclease [Bacteroides sp. 519]